MPTISFSRFKRYWKDHPGLTGLIFGVIGFVATAALSELIGGIISGWLVDVLYPWLIRSTSTANWLLFVGFVITLGAVALLTIRLIIPSIQSNTAPTISTRNAFVLASSYYKLESYLQLLHKVDDLLRQSLVKGRNEESLREFIDKFYITVFRQYGIDKLMGGDILLIDEESSNWLFGWHAAPGKPGTNKRFFIGPENQRDETKPRGTSGMVFLENKPRIVQIFDRQRGITDDPDFHYFNQEEDQRAAIPESSFVSIPMHWRDNVIGVITLHSNQLNTFSQDDLPHFQHMADKVGDALALHGRIKFTE